MQKAFTETTAIPFKITRDLIPERSIGVATGVALYVELGQMSRKLKKKGRDEAYPCNVEKASTGVMALCSPGPNKTIKGGKKAEKRRARMNTGAPGGEVEDVAPGCAKGEPEAV